MPKSDIKQRKTCALGLVGMVIEQLTRLLAPSLHPLHATMTPSAKTGQITQLIRKIRPSSQRLDMMYLLHRHRPAAMRLERIGTERE